MIDNIKNKLQSLSPTFLEIVDESNLHIGHVGHHGRGPSHLRVRISTPAFAKLSRVECHRKINELLRDELKGDIHALSIDVI